MKEDTRSNEKTEFLPNSKGGSINFRQIKDKEGKNFIEYSVDYKLPDGLNEKEINYLKCYMVQLLHFSDYWTNIKKSPVDLQLFYYYSKLKNWVTVASFFSVFYFYKFMRIKRNYGFPVSILSTLLFMVGSNFVGNVLNGMCQIQYENYIGKELVGTNDKTDIMEFISFQNSLGAKLTNTSNSSNINKV